MKIRIGFLKVKIWNKYHRFIYFLPTIGMCFDQGDCPFSIDFLWLIWNVEVYVFKVSK